MERTENTRSLRRWVSAAGAGAFLLACITVFAWHRHVSRPAPLPPPTPPGRREARVIAHVGAEPITDAQLARYQALKQLWAGVTGTQQALNELCSRTLLVLAANEQGLQISQADLGQELFRRKLIIGALASATQPVATGMGARPQTPGMPRGFASTLDRVPEILAEAGLSEADLAEEAKAEALAAKVRQRLVYDTIDIPREDLLAAAAATSTTDGGPPPTDEVLAPVRERLRRERGATQMTALIARLGEKWKVQVVAAQ